MGSSFGGQQFLLQTGPLLAAADHIPAANDEACLRIETQGAVGPINGTCHWQAITVLSNSGEVPYIIATTGSGIPTPIGQEIVGQQIPAPQKSASCTCATALEADDPCCEAADDGVEFYYYPWPDPAKLYPGATGSLSLERRPSPISSRCFRPRSSAPAMLRT